MIKKTGEATLQQMLHDDVLRLEKVENLTSFLIKGSFIATVTIVIVFGGILFLQNARHEKRIEVIQLSAERQIESNRVSLLEGLYSVRSTAEDAISTRNQRLERFLVQGKRVILERHSKTDLTDRQINNMLRKNFELSERYDISPWIFMAFAAVESDFTTGAVSVAGARGIVQFMPSTMAMVMGDRYRPGMEHDPVVSVEAWYKYISYLSNAVDGDLEWTAAAYMTPTAIRWRNKGKTVEEFMEWVVSWSQNQVQYPQNIRRLVMEYNTL